MLVYKSDMNYGVYLEDDGDDLWITVTNGYCVSYDCIVGSTDEPIDVAVCVDSAYRCFFPAQYMTDHLEATDDRFRVVALARDANEIDRALEMALSEQNKRGQLWLPLPSGVFN